MLYTPALVVQRSDSPLPLCRMPSTRLCDSLLEPAPTAGSAVPGAWPTILVVDHDTVMLTTLVCYFEKRGFHVAAAASLAEAKMFFHRCKTWSLVISEYHLPDGSGWELCCWMRDQPGLAPPFLLMSGSVHVETLCSGTDYLAKPFAIEQLESHVRMMLRRGPA